jgi:hypothetical protein
MADCTCTMDSDGQDCPVHRVTPEMRTRHRELMASDPEYAAAFLGIVNVKCPACGTITSRAADNSVPCHKTVHGKLCHGHSDPLA